MRFAKLIVPAVALGLFAVIPTHIVRADDAPATPPAATQPATGSTVTIKVVDESGNPVEGAKVSLIVGGGHKHGDPAAAAGAPKPVPVASGVTDASGSVTLTAVPDGSYRANAVVKGVGAGHEKLTVGGDAAAAPLTITIKPRQPKPAAPTSQPAAQ